MSDREIEEVKAAMLYALLATVEVDPPNAGSGYNWLSSRQPETAQSSPNLNEVCGQSGWPALWEMESKC